MPRRILDPNKVWREEIVESVNELPRWWVWGVGITIVAVNGWLWLPVLRYLQPLFTLVTVAALLAFFLEYPVLLLISRGLRRSYAVTSVFGLVLLLLVILGVTLLPLLLQQLDQFSSHLPSWIESGAGQLQTLQVLASARRLPIDVSAVTAQLQDRLGNELQILPSQVLSLVVGTFNSTLDIFLVVVLTFYLLLDGERLWTGILEWFPSNWGRQMQISLSQSFRNYYLGQVILAGCMGVAVTIAFLLLRVPFGLLFGIGIGVLVLIPLGDILGIISISLLTALENVWLGLEVLVIAVLIDLAIDHLVAPRLIGKLVSLNPVWIIICLLLGAKVGGILGVIIAVPLAGAMKNLVDSLRQNNYLSTNAPP